MRLCSLPPAQNLGDDCVDPRRLLDPERPDPLVELGPLHDHPPADPVVRQGPSRM